MLLLSGIAAATWLFLIIFENITNKISLTKKRIIKAAAFTLALALFISFSFYAYITSDTYKMLKEIKPNDLYGMTVEEVKKEYYCPEDGKNDFLDEGYVFCAAHLAQNDWGTKYYDRYYIKPDKNGVVVDVKIIREN